MVCKFEMISENDAHETIYICDKYGFSNRSICTKRTQPNCYEEKYTDCSGICGFCEIKETCDNPKRLKQIEMEIIRRKRL